MTPQKKLKSIFKHSQEPITSKGMQYQPKKAALSFKCVKTQGVSGSQDQKERKTASIETKTFSDKKHHSANSLLQRSQTK